MKQNTIWLVAFVFSTALAVVAGIFYGPKVHSIIQSPSSDTVIQSQQVSELTAGLGESFEVILNGFLSELSLELKGYKNQRKVLTELIDPFNLRNPEYIDQNYEMIQVLAPELRARMDGVMALFSKTDKQVKSTLNSYPEKSVSGAAAKWSSIRDNQVERYIYYLKLDDEILLTFEELLAFYAKQKEQMYYDFETDEIRFKSELFLQTEQKYLESIAELTRIRNAVLKQNI